MFEQRVYLDKFRGKEIGGTQPKHSHWPQNYNTPSLVPQTNNKLKQKPPQPFKPKSTPRHLPTIRTHHERRVPPEHNHPRQNQNILVPIRLYNPRPTPNSTHHHSTSQSYPKPRNLQRQKPREPTRPPHRLPKLMNLRL